MEAYGQLRTAVAELDGKPVPTVWTAVDNDGAPTGGPIAAELAVQPTYQSLWYAEPIPDVVVARVEEQDVASEHAPRALDIAHPGDDVMSVSEEPLRE